MNHVPQTEKLSRNNTPGHYLHFVVFDVFIRFARRTASSDTITSIRQQQTMKFLLSVLLLTLLRLDGILGRSLSLELYNPCIALFIGKMDEDGSLGLGEGLAASDAGDGGPKVEIGFEEQGYVTFFNPDPVQQWVGNIGSGDMLKLDQDYGLVLLDVDDEVLKTFFQKRCEGNMMHLDTDGFTSFTIGNHLVGHLDGSGNDVHLDCIQGRHAKGGRSLGLIDLPNPFKVMFMGIMNEGDLLGLDEGLAASDPEGGGPKVEIGLEEQGYVAVFNPDLDKQHWRWRQA